MESDAFFKNYNKTVNPAIFNSFAGAAFRFGHSQIQDTFGRFDKDQHELPAIPADENFNPTFLYDMTKGGIDSICRGLIKEASQKVDGYVS